MSAGEKQPILLPARAIFELKQIVEELGRKTEQARLAFGKTVGAGDGDGYHDEAASLLEQEKLLAEGRLFQVQSWLEQAMELKPPEQNQQVVLGHRAEILLDGEQEKIGVTILTKEGTEVLYKHFDMDKEVVVSAESPWGQGLLGHKKGERVTLGQTAAAILGLGVSPEVFGEDIGSRDK